MNLENLSESELAEVLGKSQNKINHK